MNGFAAFAAFVYAMAVTQSGLAAYCVARALSDLKSGRRLWAVSGLIAAAVAAYWAAITWKSILVPG
jgi:hypothetical protein